ncbi:MAG TPA: glucosamine-6-phosphate deaminase [Chthoniobacteraceae bacterium]|nr:glucosamine-6-phosphate deaminase [Chthoniobacteraceae bacterium]
MEVIIKSTPDAASNEAARIFAAQLRRKPASVLGLATGSTPLGLYRELAARHERGEIDFSAVTTFNLDEYIGLPATHPRSYANYMRELFFSKIKIPPGRTHIPDGMAPDIPAHCAEYEAAIKNAGGIDLQLLGLGTDAHIGFNEPGSSLTSRTRLKTLTENTIRDNARFFANSSEVPRHVITMGIGTIMEARHCVVLATGEKKARAVAAMAEGPVTADAPASILQMHPHCTLIIDEAAAAESKRRDYYRWVYDNKPEWQRV